MAAVAIGNRHRRLGPHTSRALRAGRLQADPIRVPRDGAFPLSPSMDSIGPIGVKRRCCALTDGGHGWRAAPRCPLPLRPRASRIGIVQDGHARRPEAPVAAAFERAVSTLSRTGAPHCPICARELGDYARINSKGALTVPEAVRLATSN